jgi:hypothetical protein
MSTFFANHLIRLYLHFNFGVTQLEEELGPQEARYTENKIVIISESHICIVISIKDKQRKETYASYIFQKKNVTKPQYLQ